MIPEKSAIPIAECRSTTASLFLTSGVVAARSFVLGQLKICGPRNTGRRVSLMIQMGLLDLDSAQHEDAIAIYHNIRKLRPKRTEELFEYCIDLCQNLTGDGWRDTRRGILDFVFERSLPFRSPLCLRAAALYVSNRRVVPRTKREDLKAILEYSYKKWGIPRPSSASVSLERQAIAADQAYRGGAARFQRLLVKIAASPDHSETLRREFLEAEPVGWFRRLCKSLTPLRRKGT